MLAAAAAAAVLLVGGGVTYALVGKGGEADRGQVAGGEAPESPTGEPGRVLDPGAPGAKPSSGAGAPSSATPSKEGATPSASPSSPAAGASSAPSPSASRTTRKPAPGATAGGGSGGGTSPSPASGGCTSRGGGAYDCQVWRTEKTYRHDGGETGVLNAGTNYFYCQVNLGRRETYGQWTNVWWARTDDDSGNTNVYFSVVYLKGGDNDRPIPGLPVC
ncbi:hypothetical protein [Streptomyces roseicoloratus]|uniref:hypothetical protein n=1 Tax=Streptomyces roseicoloratus TaxID=2508722 RepID=UPI0035A6F725